MAGVGGEQFAGGKMGQLAPSFSCHYFSGMIPGALGTQQPVWEVHGLIVSAPDFMVVFA